jgi:predicted DNA-binding protein with PD1-like motif
MPDHLSGLPRPRTIVHPGTYGAVRIEHMQAARGRHYRLSLPQGRSLYDSIVEALASVDVHNASMTFCLARPDATGRVVAAYSAPELVQSARFIFGNATLGKTPAGTPVVHCHGVFRTSEGDVRGGHVLTEKAIVGASPVKVVATALDGFDLRISLDEETRMPLLRPTTEDQHA